MLISVKKFIYCVIYYKFRHTFVPYTSGEVTSQNLWPRYDRHFVGITYGVKERKFIVLFDPSVYENLRPYDH